MSVPFLAIAGYHALLDSRAGRFVEQPGEGDSADITWNFEKFLVNLDGEVVARFPPPTNPEEIAEQLPALLG